MHLVKTNRGMKSVRVSEVEYQALFDAVIFLHEQGKTSEADVLDSLAKKIHLAMSKTACRKSIESLAGSEVGSSESSFGPQSPLEFIGKVLAIKSLLCECASPPADMSATQVG